MLERLIRDQLLQALEVTELLGQLDVMLLFAVDGHTELEKIDSLSPLDDLVVELCSNVWPLDVVRVAATRLLIREKKDV